MTGRPSDQPPPPASTAAPKSGKRKRVLTGVGLLLALAAAGYATHYFIVGRFMVSTDDSYVRANNTMLGARVSGHIQEIVPRDNSVVRKGDVIFRIDDGDYKIAVDAARSKRGKPMAKCLAEELFDAYNNQGAAVTKKENVHKMAEANSAYSHFAW